MTSVVRGVRGTAFLALLTLHVGACGRDSTKSPDAAKAPAALPQRAAGGSGAALKPACARTGHWIPCQVRDRIDRAGLTPHDTTLSIELPSLGPAPAAYRIGKSVLVVYLFADSSARASSAHRLDTTKYVPDTHPLTVLSEATVVQNDNLLALLFGKNEHQRERVSDALTAGPPQP